MKKKIYLSSPTMNGSEMDYIKEAFDTNWIAPLGANVDGFEEDIVSFTDCGNATALSSGTSALHLAIKLAGVKPGERVFCPSMTFSASVNPVMYENGVPVFIDSESDSWNIDPAALRLAFEKYPDTKTVVAVNLYGVPAKLDEIRDICDSHGAFLIEDAAESLGASYKGKMTGTFGDIGIYSFNGNKIITTSGGGMLVSSNKSFTEKARFLATQAREPYPYYHHKEIGYNYRMSNVLAGIGRGQMKTLSEYVSRKEKIYDTYLEAFKAIPGVKMNPYTSESSPNFWLSCITLDKSFGVTPDDIVAAAADENIECRHIWKPMHMQPVYSDCELISVAESPVCEDIFAHGVCLPSDIKMDSEDIVRVIDLIKGLLK